MEYAGILMEIYAVFIKTDRFYAESMKAMKSFSKIL